MTYVWAPSLPFSEMQQWAVEAETRGVWTVFRRQAWPLPEFPDDHIARIRDEVECDVKPEYWLQFELCQMPSRAWYEWHWQRGIDPDKIRRSLPAALRQYIIARDGYLCGICGGDVEPTDVHIDHIYPVALGGDDEPSNLRVAHSLCNMKKGAKV